MMRNEQIEETNSELDPFDILRGLLSSARHLMRWGVLIVAVAIALSLLQTRTSYSPVYQASASFTVRVSNPLYAGQQYYNSSAAEQMAKTFPYILTSGVLSQQVMQELEIGYMPPVSAGVMGSTNIFTLTVTSGDPQLAYDVLQCIMEIYPSVAEFVVGSTTLTLLSETGVPTAPINSVSYSSAAVKGAVMGLGVWLVLALLYWLTHRTVGSEKELRSVVNLPCLGVLPMAAGFGKGKKGWSYPTVSEGNDKFGFSESVRLLTLRTEKAMTSLGGSVLLVTSTIANEGKTTVSMNLATALAQKGKKTLLVDCDLRNPSVAGIFGQKGAMGMTEFLQGKVPAGEILRHTDNPNLYVIFGGKPVSHPQQLLGSEATQAFMNAARGTFDYVILDTPPCALMADAAEIGALADCTLLTVRQDFACRQQILEGVRLLSDSGKPIIGCAMNMTTPQLGKSSYSYYGYYGQ